MRKNIKLVIAYDGTGYAGWQRQAAGRGLGVQQVIEDTLGKLLGDVTHITGAGRTDAGVHALGQVANFYTESSLPVERLAYALNNRLPHDIRVLMAEEVAADFHARYAAIGKTYCYYITPESKSTVFQNRYSWHLAEQLDIEKMQGAAAYFLGEHDFRNFAASGSSVQDFVRRIDVCEITAQQVLPVMPWLESGSFICFRLSGNGFLYKMVRNIVGTLVQVGKGLLEPEMIAVLIGVSEKPNLRPAPAHGLFMEQVYYDEDAYKQEISSE